MPIGIVLSGGGAKGDFELGALRAMYNRGIRPAVLTGTSVGSINAVKLAEDPTSDGPLTQLESIWFGQMNYDSDMYIEDPNFAKVDYSIKSFLRYNWFTIGYALFTVASSGVVGLIGDVADAVRIGVDAKNFIDGIAAFLNAGSKSLYLLGPIRQKLVANLSKDLVAHSGAQLRMAMVSLESGRVRYVNQAGQFIDDGTSVDLIQATIASASIPGIFPPQNINGENFVDGGIRDVLPIQAALDAGADQVYAVTASRAGVDAAGSFDRKTIKDIAMRATAEIMSDQIQSFETNPPAQPWPSNVLIIQPDFTVHDSFTIDPGLIRINSGYGYMRAAELVDFARSSDPLDIFRLSLLYSLSSQIAKLRLQIWTLEYGAAGVRTPHQEVIDPQLRLTPSPEIFLQVRELKRQLKTLLEHRAALYGASPRIKIDPPSLDFGDVPICTSQTQFITVKNLADGGNPPSYSKLWLEFEAHPWSNQAATTPWSSFVSVAGSVPAATPPAPAVTIGSLELGTAMPPGPFTSLLGSLSLAPGESTTIAVTMSGQQANLGPAQVVLTIYSNDPNNPTLSVPLTGRLVQSPPILDAPPSKDFGGAFLGQSNSSSIMVRNPGCADLVITQLDVNRSNDAAAFSVDDPAVPFTIPSGGSTLIDLSFTPFGSTYTYGWSATLSIVSANGQPLSASVELTGTSWGLPPSASGELVGMRLPGGPLINSATNVPPGLARVLALAQEAGRKATAVPANQTTSTVGGSSRRPIVRGRSPAKRKRRRRKSS